MVQYIFNPFTSNFDAIGPNGGSGTPTITTTPITTSTVITGSNINATYLVDATSGNVTLTLPVSASNIYNVKKIDSTANTVTIVPASGLIDGAANAVISTQWTNIESQGNGTNLYIL